MSIFLQTQVTSTIIDSSKLITKYSEQAIDSIITFLPKILLAIVFYFIGNWVIKKLMFLAKKALDLKKLDISLVQFSLSGIKIALSIFLFLSIASVIGIPITGFAALLAGAGLAIGGAMNGSLGNLAGGVMMMIFKPFKVGDVIEAQGQTGVVKELGIFSTVILTPDNKTTYIPNGALSTGVISNFKTQGSLRLDLEFAIANRVDFQKAKEIIIKALESDAKVLKEPAPSVTIKAVGGGKITLAVRPYAIQEDYWSVHNNALENISQAFIDEGI